MTRVVDGRMTHRHEGELVVFHIGMQINKWWRPDLWLPVFSAMPRMLRELSIDKDSGLLSGWWVDSFHIASALAVPRTDPAPNASRA